MTNTVSRTLSDETLNCIITIESGGNPNARASTSSALGLGQFIDATWLSTVKKHMPEAMEGKTQSQVLAMRLNPSFMIDMLARFEEDNQQTIGAGCTPGDIYLAHFLGAGTAQKLYRGEQSAPVSAYVSAAAIKANKSVLSGKTVKEVRAWAAKRMAQSGGHDWVKKYYRMTKPTGLAAISESLPETISPTGDPDLLAAQSQLKGMHYYTGDLDGLWGGKTSEAISGFINDRGGFISAPTSADQYERYKAQIKIALDKAETEKFTRPVTEARETEDPATVARIAPEVVPARKTLWATASSFVVTFFLALWDTVSNLASTLWSFFSDNKANIPDSVKDPTFINTIFHKVPPSVWLFLVAAILAFIGVHAYRSVQKINNAVSTGAR